MSFPLIVKIRFLVRIAFKHHQIIIDPIKIRKRFMQYFQFKLPYSLVYLLLASLSFIIENMIFFLTQPIPILYTAYQINVAQSCFGIFSIIFCSIRLVLFSQSFPHLSSAPFLFDFGNKISW